MTQDFSFASQHNLVEQGPLRLIRHSRRTAPIDNVPEKERRYLLHHAKLPVMHAPSWRRDGAAARMIFLLLATLPCALAGCGGAAAQAMGDAQLCRAAIAAAENGRRIPDGFLSAIARVESGRPIAGSIEPWPWTVNAEGQGYFYASKEEAIAAVRGFTARGMRSIDVGCMQISLLYHPEAFSALEEAFDPMANARAAAGLLVSLFGQTGSWPRAAAAYHSQTPAIGAAYQKQVLDAWAMPDRPRSAVGVNATAAPPQTTLTPQMAMAAQGGAQTSLGPPASAASGPSFGRTIGVLATEPPVSSGPRGTGRGLDAYRAMPVRLALRPAGRTG